MKTASELLAKELVDDFQSLLFRLHSAQVKVNVSASEVNLELAKAGYSHRIYPRDGFYAVFPVGSEEPVEEDIYLLVDAIRTVKRLEQA